MTPYPHLFTPIKIGGQLIKNRIFSAPTGLMSYTSRGHLTTENMAYYELKAKGGCGVVTLGESIVHAATGQSHDRQICLDDPHVLPSLTNTARASLTSSSHRWKTTGRMSSAAAWRTGRGSS